MNKEKVKEIVIKALKELGTEFAILTGKKIISVSETLKEEAAKATPTHEIKGN